VDTDSIGYTTISAGSGTGSGASASAFRVAVQIRDRMVERAAQIWSVDPSLVSYDQWSGVLSGPADDTGKTRTMTFKELAAQQGTTGGYISGHVDLGGAQGGPTFAGHIVDVDVDPATGKINIARYTVVQDVGKAMHPVNVEGQIQGGAAQGIGMALSEEYFYDEQGVLRNSSLLDYRQPTTLDVPMIDTVLVECPNPGHPLGVRGIGEMAIVPPLGAIANAIHSATGIRVHSLPATPRALLEEMLESRDGGYGA
jgi:CO/xanthine dehydrogenase Mo-binding subunit